MTKGCNQWIMSPKASLSASENSCVIHDFSIRHELSSRSMLDSVEPVGMASGTTAQ